MGMESLQPAKSRSRWTPGSRFALAVTAIAVAFAVLGSLLAWRVYVSERDHEIEVVAQTATIAGFNADAFLNDRLDILNAIAYAPPIRNGDLAGMRAYFESLDPEGLRFGGGIGWVDRDGWVQVFTTTPAENLPIYIGDREHVQSVLADQAPYVGEAIIGRQNPYPILPFAVPTFDASGQFSGVLVGTIRLDLLEAAAKEQRFGAKNVTIVDRSGNVIVHPGPFAELDNIAGHPLVAIAGQNSPGVLEGVTGLDGTRDHVVGYSTVPIGSWTVLVDRSEDELYGDARRTFVLEVGGLVFFVLAVSAGSVSIGRRINKSAARELAALQELEVREARLRSLTEATTQVIWTVDPSGELREPAKRWGALTGIPVEKLDLETWLPYVHEEDREPGNEHWMKGIASGQMIEFEQRVTRHDGRVRHFLVRAVPVRETDGRIREWIGVDIDVTEQRRAEAALRDGETESRETAERLSLALEAGQLNTWDWDVRNDRIVWSESSEVTLGPTPPQFERFIDGVHPEDRARVREAVRRSLEERAPYEVEYRSMGVDGKHRWLYVRGEAFHDHEGRPLRMLGVDVDVTERKNREMFEQDFVANVAHDIKNPLAAVKAQTQLLRRRIKNGKTDPESMDGVLAVLDAGLTRMNRRIEELADVARLRAGRQLELRKELVNLVTMVRGLVESYRQTTERHTITFIALEPDLIGLVDSGRIERVVDNLISNAVKYSPEGGEIQVELIRVPESPNLVRLVVSDDGIGIPESDLPYIFERYRRAGNTAVITGTGIGLAGSRQIVEQHGGTIDVESREGTGSIFTVLLPLTDPNASTRPPQSDGHEAADRQTEGIDSETGGQVAVDLRPART